MRRRRAHSTPTLLPQRQLPPGWDLPLITTRTRYALISHGVRKLLGMGAALLYSEEGEWRGSRGGGDGPPASVSGARRRATAVRGLSHELAAGSLHSRRVGEAMPVRQHGGSRLLIEAVPLLLAASQCAAWRTPWSACTTSC